MRIPSKQRRVLNAMGNGFEPCAVVEIARRVYPNHAAWAKMGKEGEWAWSGLVTKVSSMLGALQARGLVWQVGAARWATSNKFNVTAVQDYWDWIAVCCDALDGDGELYEDAVDAVYWYIVHYCSQWRRPGSSPRNPDVILMCVRATLGSLGRLRDGRHKHLHSGAVVVDLGVRELVKDKVLASDVGLELKNSIREHILGIPQFLHFRRGESRVVGSKQLKSFEELIEVLDKEVCSPIGVASTGDIAWVVTDGTSNAEG